MATVNLLVILIFLFDRDTSQLILLLAHLYDALPCDVAIMLHQNGSLSSLQDELLKSLHKEAGAIKNQLMKEKRESPTDGFTLIDFSASVDAVRHQVELQRDQLLKRKASDEQTVDVLSNIISDLQVQSDAAAEHLVMKTDYVVSL